MLIEATKDLHGQINLGKSWTKWRLGFPKRSHPGSQAGHPSSQEPRQAEGRANRGKIRRQLLSASTKRVHFPATGVSLDSPEGIFLVAARTNLWGKTVCSPKSPANKRQPMPSQHIRQSPKSPLPASRKFAPASKLGFQLVCLGRRRRLNHTHPNKRQLKRAATAAVNNWCCNLGTSHPPNLTLMMTRPGDYRFSRSAPFLVKIGAPGRIRTCGLRIRRPVHSKFIDY